MFSASVFSASTSVSDFASLTNPPGKKPTKYGIRANLHVFVGNSLMADLPRARITATKVPVMLTMTSADGREIRKLSGTGKDSARFLAERPELDPPSDLI